MVASYSRAATKFLDQFEAIVTFRVLDVRMVRLCDEMLVDLQNLTTFIAEPANELR